MTEKTIHFVGTAHVSHKSVEDVREAIQKYQPDTVCIELCEPRYEAMIDQDKWKKMDIFQVIKSGRAAFLLAQLLLSSFYQKIGDKLGIEPGAEMKEAIHQAQACKAEIILADRRVDITLKRVWRHLSIWKRFKLLFQALTGFFEDDELDEAAIEKIKEEGELESMMEAFAKSFPEIKQYLIDERDEYLAHKISSAPGNTIVAVVGAGHLKGINKHFNKVPSVEHLEKIPLASPISKVLKWSIPLVILAIPVWGFFTGETEQSMDSLSFWIASHSLLAGLGATIALAHPLTIAAATVSAPFTSLNPMIAAGWIAGLVQAWVKKPTVEDLEGVPQAIRSASGFWKNSTTRILLVVVLANIGSSLGTLLSGAWVFYHF